MRSDLGAIALVLSFASGDPAAAAEVMEDTTWSLASVESSDVSIAIARALMEATGIAEAPYDRILATKNVPATLLEIDRKTGLSTTLFSSPDPDDVFLDVAVDRDGDIFVLATTIRRGSGVFQIDPVAGTMLDVSSLARLGNAGRLHFDAKDRLVVVDRAKLGPENVLPPGADTTREAFGTLIQIDSTTGEQRALSLEASPGSALTVIINNGLAPPHPDNVIDHYMGWNTNVSVRNVGNTIEGAPTTVALVPGGYVEGVFSSRNSSIVEMGNAVALIGSPRDFSTWKITGGSFAAWLAADDWSTVIKTNGGGQYMDLYESSTVCMSGGFTSELNAYGSFMLLNGGRIGNKITAGYSSLLRLTGAEFNAGGRIWARNSSVIVIVGSGFEVDDIPVPFGNLSAQSGVLTGALASGDTMTVSFRQGGFCDPNSCFDGTITLAEAGDSGACCLGIRDDDEDEDEDEDEDGDDDRVCENLAEQECLDLGGVFQGLGTQCAGICSEIVCGN